MCKNTSSGPGPSIANSAHCYAWNNGAEKLGELVLLMQKIASVSGVYLIGAGLGIAT